MMRLMQAGYVQLCGLLYFLVNLEMNKRIEMKSTKILCIFWLFVNNCGLALAVASRDILSFSGWIFAFIWPFAYFVDEKD